MSLAQTEVGSNAFPSKRGDRLRIFAFFVLAFVVYMAGSRGTITTVDTQIRYLVANRLWDDGSVHPHPEDLAATGGSFARGRHGDPVSPFGLGQSLFMLPAVAAADAISMLAAPESRAHFRYLAGQFLYKVILLPLWAASSLVAIYFLARRLGLDRRGAGWTALAVGFGTTWWYYAKTIGHELEITTLVLFGLALFHFDRGLGRLALSGACFGLTFLYRMDFIVPVGAIVTAFAREGWRSREIRFGRAASFLSPLIVCGLIVLWHNFERTGTVLDAGYHGALEGAERSLFAGPGEHFGAITLGFHRGLLWFSPILFAFVLVPFARPLTLERPKGSVWIWSGVVLFAFVFFVSSVDLSAKVGGWGQRYLVPVVPFATLGLAVLLSARFESRSWRRALVAFVFANIALQACFSFHEHGEVQRQRRLARAHGAELDGWRGTDWAATLRNLGVPLGDPETLTIAWSEPDVRAIRTSPAENLWWLKLARAAGVPLRPIVLLLGGLVLSTAIALFAFRVARSLHAGEVSPGASLSRRSRRRVT